MRQQSIGQKTGWEMFIQPWPAFPATALVLLMGSFFYVWLRIEPAFQYYSSGPFFFWQQGFRETFLGRPGGVVNYAGTFLAQFDSVNWWGALAFVIGQVIILLASLFCMARLSGKLPGLLALLPPFMLLLMRNRHGCPVSVFSVGFILALAASAVCLSVPWRRPWLLTVASGMVSGLLFFGGGLWCSLLFAVLAALLAILQMRNWLAGLGCLLLALAGPLLAFTSGKVELSGLINPWPEGAPKLLAGTLYSSVPVLTILLVLLREPDKYPAFLRPGARFQNASLGLLAPYAILLGGGILLILTFDRRQKLLDQIDYYANRGEHEAVLAAASQLNMLNDPAMIRVHWALYHTGRLAEDLFSFHNMIEVAPVEGVAEGYRAQSLPLFELGLVNDAEHLAYEALELGGERPDLLRLLARINLVKDQPKAAQIFLNVLSQIPFQDKQIIPTWPVVDPALPIFERAGLDQVRSRMLTNDVMHDGLPLGRLFDALLESNPSNQMAFEYAMASSLMDLDLKKAMELLPQLERFPYTRIPRSYEEAALLYQQRAGVQADLKGRTIRPETITRFGQLKEALQQLKGRADAQAIMAANFGDTYWYYFAVRSRERAVQGQNSAP